MPLDYHISSDEGLITVHGEGEVHVDEIMELGQSLLRDAAFDPELPQLLDFRGLRPVTAGEPERLLAFVNGQYREAVTASVAVVIDDHLEDSHCADIFLLTCAMGEAELFSDYDQALKWLMRQEFVSQTSLLPAPLYPSGEQEYAGGDHADRAPEQ